MQRLLHLRLAGVARQAGAGVRRFGHLQHQRGQAAVRGQALHLVRRLALLVRLVVHLAQDQQVGRGGGHGARAQQGGSEAGQGRHAR